MNTETDLGHLIKALGSKDGQIRKNAIDHLAIMETPPIDVFIKLLISKSDTTRSSIEDVLIRIGTPAVSHLIASLNSENRDMRMKSARVLGKIRDPVAKEPLSRALKDDHWYVALEAEKALKSIANSQSLLIRESLLTSKTIDQNKQEITDLSQQPEEIPENELDEVIHDKCQEPQREEIADSTVINDYSDKIERLVSTSEINDIGALYELFEAIEYDNNYVRYLAAKGLGKIGDKKAVDVLINSLNDESSAVRKQSALSLGKLGDIKAIQPLTIASKDKNNAVCKAAKRAILKINKSKTNSEIADEETNENVARDTIKDINSSKAEVKIECSINEGNPTEIQTELLSKDLQKKKEDNDNSLDLEHESRPKTKINDVDSLIGGLNDQDIKTRRKSIQLFQNILHEGDTYALDILIKSLSDENEFVRCKAAVCLGIIKDENAIEPLELASKNSCGQFRKKAHEALRTIRRARTSKLPDKSVNCKGSNVINENIDKNEVHIIPSQTDEIMEGYTSSENTTNKIVYDSYNEIIDVGNDSFDKGHEKCEIKCNNIDSLIDGLSDLDQEIRLKSIRLLRVKLHEGNTFALDALIKSLNDRSAYIRWKAAGYLGIIRDKKAIEPLELALKDNSNHVRRKAKESLELIKNPVSIQLIDKSEHSNELNLSVDDISQIAEVIDKAPKEIINKIDSLKDDICSSSLISSAKISLTPLKPELPPTESPDLCVPKQEIRIKSFNRIPNYRILQVDTQKYDLLKALTELKEITQPIDPNHSNIQCGDIIYLWEPQHKGIVAKAIVKSSPRNIPPNHEEIKFLADSERSKQIRICLEILDVPCIPVTLRMLAASDKLKNISILKESERHTLIINQNDAKIIDALIETISKERSEKLCNKSLESKDIDNTPNNDALEEISPTTIGDLVSKIDSDITRGNSKVKIISTINLKGGVGKTTITLALAEFLCLAYNKKVLLIDLDPQTNATVSLIGEATWLEKNGKGETLYQLFKDKLDKTSKFDINKSIVRKVSNINGGIDNLSLLPSSIDLIKIQDTLPQALAGYFYVRSPITILKEATKAILDNYDFVLIDCPPNLGIITLNGIYMSDYYLIPTIPDHLSTWGIPQITDRINEFKAEANISIEPLGIIISMYRAQQNLHNTTIRRLKQEEINGKGPRVFDTIIPLRAKTSEAAEYESTVNTLKQKYGCGIDYQVFDNLTGEILKYVV